MPTVTVTTTAQRLPSGGYRNAENLSASVTVYIEPTESVASTTGGAILPGGTFSWARDYPPFWVATSASTADLRIF